MTASAHAVVGAAIAAKIPDWRISVPLLLLSHVVGDLPQHWDVGHNWQEKGLRKVFYHALVDLGLGYLIVTFVFVWWLKYDPIRVFLGAFIAQSFDYLEVPYFFFQWHTAPWKWFNELHLPFHKKFPALRLDAAGQIVIGALAILLAAI